MLLWQTAKLDIKTWKLQQRFSFLLTYSFPFPHCIPLPLFFIRSGCWKQAAGEIYFCLQIKSQSTTSSVFHCHQDIFSHFEDMGYIVYEDVEVEACLICSCFVALWVTQHVSIYCCRAWHKQQLLTALMNSVMWWNVQSRSCRCLVYCWGDCHLLDEREALGCVCDHCPQLISVTSVSFS